MRPDVAVIGPYPDLGERHAGRSGVASYTANLAHALADTGLAPVVIAPFEDGQPITATDGPVRVERRFRLGRPTSLPTAAAAAVRSGAPISHLQLEAFLYGGPAALAGVAPALAWLRGHRRGPVVTLHQVLEPRAIDRDTTRLHRVRAPAGAARAGIATLHRAIGRLAAATIVHEEPFRAAVRGAVVVPHGIEQTATLDRDSARTALGLDDRLVVLCFGFLAPYKGLEVAVDAAERAGSGVTVVVAGGEHPRLAGRGRYADELRQRGAAAQFTGWVPDADVSRWFAAADVALLPYPSPFSSSGALALALAHRTPILLSPVLARCVGAPAALAVPAEPGAIASRLRSLAADRSQLKELAEWTDALAAGRSWPEVGQRHAALYGSLRGAR
jgi:glycosyltransferase involved in cell wall biosynthesis